jgi:hypothetical protein
MSMRGKVAQRTIGQTKPASAPFRLRSPGSPAFVGHDSNF